ncbi:hypothetical protein ES705_36766 [subsurface metagenome]
MLEFPEFLRVPLADWIDAIMSWLLTNWAALFDAIGDTILLVLLYLRFCCF